MSDQTVSSISRVDLDLANRASQAEAAPASGAGSRPQAAEPAGQEAPESASRARAYHSLLPDVSLHFKIDAKTNDVTVFVLDKNTKKVLRTIPPEELAKLRQGELLELFG